MKYSHSFILLLFLFLFSFLSPCGAQSAKSVYNEAVALYQQERYEEALKKFKIVAKYTPGARAYIFRCQQALRENLGKTSLESNLARVILPEVEFQNVPLGDVLTYIRQRTQEVSSQTEGLDVVTPNIIFSGSPQQRDAALVTMKLNAVPVTTLLKYVADQTGCQVRYDAHAVMVTPTKNLPKTTAAPQTTDADLFKIAPNPFE